jgi:hypothetical protein
MDQARLCILSHIEHLVYIDQTNHTNSSGTNSGLDVDQWCGLAGLAEIVRWKRETAWYTFELVADSQPTLGGSVAQTIIKSWEKIHKCFTQIL